VQFYAGLRTIGSSVWILFSCKVKLIRAVRTLICGRQKHDFQLQVASATPSVRRKLKWSGLWSSQASFKNAPETIALDIYSEKGPSRNSQNFSNNH